VAGTVKALIAEGKCQALRHVRACRRDPSPRSCRPACDRGGKRIFPVVGEPEKDVYADLRGTRNRVRAIQPLVPAILTGKIRETATSVRMITQRTAKFTPEALESNRPVIEPAGEMGRQKGRNPAQIALAWPACPEAGVDVPIPGTTKLPR